MLIKCNDTIWVKSECTKFVLQISLHKYNSVLSIMKNTVLNMYHEMKPLKEKHNNDNKNKFFILKMVTH